MVSIESCQIPPAPLPPASLTFLNIPYQRGTLVTTDEPPLACHYHPKSIVTLGFTLGLVHSVGYKKCIKMFIHHYSIIENSCTVLRIFSIIFCCVVAKCPSIEGQTLPLAHTQTWLLSFRWVHRAYLLRRGVPVSSSIPLPCYQMLWAHSPCKDPSFPYGPHLPPRPGFHHLYWPPVLLPSNLSWALTNLDCVCKTWLSLHHHPTHRPKINLQLPKNQSQFSPPKILPNSWTVPMTPQGPQPQPWVSSLLWCLHAISVLEPLCSSFSSHLEYSAHFVHIHWVPSMSYHSPKFLCCEILLVTWSMLISVLPGCPFLFTLHF